MLSLAKGKARGSARATGRRSAAAALLLCNGLLGCGLLGCGLLIAVLAGCGREVASGGVRVQDASDVTSKAPVQPVREANELIPADLDLVLRLNLGKARKALGEDDTETLFQRALDEAPDQGLARKALAEAEVVWLGLRGADLDSGDRVMVVRAAAKSEVPDSLSWSQRDTALDGVVRHDNRTRAPRDGTASIFRFGKRDAVFVSPVELHSVERLLRDGPDEKRGQPEARGLLSLDYRARRLSPSHEDRYPSLASLVRGIERVHATVAVAGDSLRLEGRIRCNSAAEAKRVLRFLVTIRDGASERETYATLLAGLVLKRADTNVNVRWRLRRDAIRGLLRRLSPKEGRQASIESARQRSANRRHQ